MFFFTKFIKMIKKVTKLNHNQSLFLLRIKDVSEARCLWKVYEGKSISLIFVSDQSSTTLLNIKYNNL